MMLHLSLEQVYRAIGSSNQTIWSRSNCWKARTTVRIGIGNYDHCPYYNQWFIFQEQHTHQRLFRTSQG